MNGSWSNASAATVAPPLGATPRLLGEPPLSPPSPARPAAAPTLRVAEPALTPPPAPSAPVPAASPPPAPSPVQALPQPRRDAAPTFESLLLRFGLVTTEQIEEALAEQRASGREVAEIVVERGWVSPDQVTRVRAYVPMAATAPRPPAPTPVPAAPPAYETAAPRAEPAPAPAAPAPTAATAPPEPHVAPPPAPAPAEAVTARVYVRLTGGDRVEVARAADIASAKQRAAEVVDQLLAAEGSWPFIAGRFVRPDAVVSVDVEATPE